MSNHATVALCVATSALLLAACSKRPHESQAPLISDSELQSIMSQRFIDLHQSYLALDGKGYTSLLRATLRHARRLSPEQCVRLQKTLIDVGSHVGYDGLEPVWLVYQDCSAAGDAKAFTDVRTANAERLSKGLHFARKEPLPQLPLRVTYWNSTLERGVRADAVRTVMKQFAAAQPSAAQAWSLNQLLAQPTTSRALCALPTRLNQSGRMATLDLFRRAGCLSGTSPVPDDVCSKLFPPQGSDTGGAPRPGEISSLSDDQVDQIKEICRGMPGGNNLSPEPEWMT